MIILTEVASDSRNERIGFNITIGRDDRKNCGSDCPFMSVGLGVGYCDLFDSTLNKSNIRGIFKRTENCLTGSK